MVLWSDHTDTDYLGNDIRSTTSRVRFLLDAIANDRRMACGESGSHGSRPARRKRVTGMRRERRLRSPPRGS